ncbi:MAG TPA: hypothetical protein VIY48_09260 [Candidatus Paceibacterota bacterium]
MENCTYPECNCIVSTSTSHPEPECPKGLSRVPVRSNASTAIDELGVVRAQLAELAEKEKALKKSIIEMGPGAHEGELFRATVTESKRAQLDMEWVRKKLGKKAVAAHTTYTPVVTVRLAARTGEALLEDE